MSRTRGWCFTINNYSEEDILFLKQLETTYLCFGKEIAPTTGTPHLQGYLRLKNPKSWETMKELHKTAHWEAAKAGIGANRRYCSKEGEFWEQGVKPRQGARTDLEAVAELVQNGASLEEVAEEHPATFVRYARGLTALKGRLTKDRSEMPEVVWLWGSTGVGKTREAMSSLSVYMKDGTQWWDGYDQQERIVIDDFDGKWPFRDFLRLLDRYPYQGQTKGGYVKINSKEIYITAEFPPSNFWSGSQLAQVNRRISRCTEVKCTEVEGNTRPQTSV